MKAIFIDVTGLTPKQLKKVIKTIKHILFKNDQYIAVTIGNGYFDTLDHWKICKGLCLKEFKVSKYLGMDKGVEIQEWINHHVNIENICVISNEEELHPVDIYRISYHRFFLKYYIKRMLQKPFKDNAMSKFFKINARKMF